MTAATGIVVPARDSTWGGGGGVAAVGGYCNLRSCFFGPVEVCVWIVSAAKVGCTRYLCADYGAVWWRARVDVVVMRCSWSKAHSQGSCVGGLLQRDLVVYCRFHLLC